MSDNSRKTPLASSLNRFARKTINDAYQLTGKALPASIVSADQGIVTVKFEVTAGSTPLPNVTIAIAESQYNRLPLQPGDNGVVVPADVLLGGITGLGSGTPSLYSQAANLGALVFLPTANAGWADVDGTKTFTAGPNGAIIQDLSGAAIINVDKTNGIKLSFGGHSIEIKSDNVYIDGKPFLPHSHSGVMTGGSDTGPVV